MLNDRPLLPRKSSRRIALSGLCRAGGICPAAQRQMPFYGEQNVLRELQGALLQAGNARKDPRGNALFGTADDIPQTGHRNAAFDLSQG